MTLWMIFLIPKYTFTVILLIIHGYSNNKSISNKLERFQYNTASVTIAAIDGAPFRVSDLDEHKFSHTFEK